MACESQSSNLTYVQLSASVSEKLVWEGHRKSRSRQQKQLKRYDENYSNLMKPIVGFKIPEEQTQRKPYQGTLSSNCLKPAEKDKIFRVARGKFTNSVIKIRVRPISFTNG